MKLALRAIGWTAMVAVIMAACLFAQNAITAYGSRHWTLRQGLTGTGILAFFVVATVRYLYLRSMQRLKEKLASIDSAAAAGRDGNG